MKAKKINKKKTKIYSSIEAKKINKKTKIYSSIEVKKKKTNKKTKIYSSMEAKKNFFIVSNSSLYF